MFFEILDLPTIEGRELKFLSSHPYNRYTYPRQESMKTPPIFFFFFPTSTKIYTHTKGCTCNKEWARASVTKSKNIKRHKKRKEKKKNQKTTKRKEKVEGAKVPY